MTTTRTGYLDELRSALACYAVEPVEAEQVVAEVDAHVADTGEDPVDAFGPPWVYAAQYAPPTPTRVASGAVVPTPTAPPSGIRVAGMVVLGVVLAYGLLQLARLLAHTLRNPAEVLLTAVTLAAGALAVRRLRPLLPSGTPGPTLVAAVLVYGGMGLFVITFLNTFAWPSVRLSGFLFGGAVDVLFGIVVMPLGVAWSLLCLLATWWLRRR